jgi:hypothetical protein
MAKRNINEWNGELDKESRELKQEIVNKPSKFYEELEETIPLELLEDIHLKITGKVTGKLYEFYRGGAILNVNKKDAEIMLTKVSGQCDCPGNKGSNPYFRIAR